MSPVLFLTFIEPLSRWLLPEGTGFQYGCLNKSLHTNATGAAGTSFTGVCLQLMSCRGQHAPGTYGTYTCLNIARSPWVLVLVASAACRSSSCSFGPAAFLHPCVLLRYFYDLFSPALASLMFVDWHVASPCVC